MGHQISTLGNILGADLINLNNKFKKLSLKTNFRKYEKFKDNYLKYPNSKNMNSWQLLENFLLKK